MSFRAPSQIWAALCKSGYPHQSAILGSWEAAKWEIKLLDQEHGCGPHRLAQATPVVVESEAVVPKKRRGRKSKVISEMVPVSDFVPDEAHSGDGVPQEWPL